MSGILGIFHRNGNPVDLAQVRQMVEAIAHRGPDKRGEWLGLSIAFGHVMLWTTEESNHEKLPCSENGLVITADARIDNRNELWNSLGNDGAPSVEVADSQLILYAYRKWGVSCVNYLVGDFAFAIWDEAEKSLFCARDHFGVKPLYYHLSDNLFAFGSEIKVTLSIQDVSPDLDETKILDFLTPNFDDTSNTFYTNVRRLPPANCLLVKAESVKCWRYWELDAKREIRFASDEEYAERFRELFSQAVSRRLRSAYPVGSMLSGGLDSSAVSCMAQALISSQSREKLHTFSAVFDDVPQSDESHYINAARSEYDFEPHLIRGDEFSPWGELERVLWHQDEALYAFNHFLNWNLYSEAQKNGVRVLLDGFDGDTTVSHGDGYLIELARSNRLIALSREARAKARSQNQSTASVFWGYLWHYRLNPAIRKRRFLRLVQKFLINRRKKGGSRTTNDANIIKAIFAGRVTSSRDAPSSGSDPLTERELHYKLLNWGVMPYTLEILDKSAPAFSIEPRYPFWDKDLVEFCLALPPGQKIRNGWGRLIMRRGLEGILPKAIQWRRDKSNLGYNFEHCLSKYEAQRLNDVIVNRSAEIEAFVNLDEIRAALKRFVSGDATDEDIMALWRAASLALWLEFVSADATGCSYT